MQIALFLLVAFFLVACQQTAPAPSQQPMEDQKRAVDESYRIYQEKEKLIDQHDRGTYGYKFWHGSDRAHEALNTTFLLRHEMEERSLADLQKSIQHRKEFEEKEKERAKKENLLSELNFVTDGFLVIEDTNITINSVAKLLHRSSAMKLPMENIIATVERKKEYQSIIENKMLHKHSASGMICSFEEEVFECKENWIVGYLLGTKEGVNEAILKHNKAERDYEAAINRQPERVRKAIFNREVFIGMTDKQVLLSFGKPAVINKSAGSWGVKEQWIYTKGSARQYLYFYNGTLDSYSQY